MINNKYLCAVEHSCFRAHIGCVADACVAIATWKPTEDMIGVLFQMSTSDTWMAVGLSQDDKMVYSCAADKITDFNFLIIFDVLDEMFYRETTTFLHVFQALVRQP